ncbi:MULTISPECIES: YgaP family membrane protein [Pseudoalteromonas]|uniref:Sulfurtransferase n=1 Tax=Pseudoalteromonas amylolytica TaxID=1859457 RepID=A0A1S1MS37_9GAMM|nr:MULTISPECIES: DUF2892 domain-containing protein [Pseudoalteromonas]MCF6437532.1 DUF2892 domain-containing protein [Pseudoalteromonas sp. MMG022]OHU85992.1 sulfurtransferase [Pseudoalteromonas sp. JW3]OHU89398.1 sulfurtransferase [Pseudoalteromonas amylolytica]
MKLNPMLRLIAGMMFLISLALTHYVNQNWLWFSVFIAANLIQSAFTNSCPMITLLKKLGVKE